MPINTTLFPAFVALVASYPVVAVVATAPSDTSVYAVLGAVPASVCTLLGAQVTRKPRIEQIMVFIGSCAIGSIGPDAMISLMMLHGKLTTDVSLSWAVWAALGFLMGISGWGTIQTILALWNRFVTRKTQDYLDKHE